MLFRICEALAAAAARGERCGELLKSESVGVLPRALDDFVHTGRHQLGRDNYTIIIM